MRWGVQSMTIRATKIRKSRVPRWCASCRKGMPVGTPQWSLYGMADAGDKPYTIHVCCECKEKRDG